MDKCSLGNGITIKPDGINELDPCIYEDIEIYHNVTVIVSKCTRCGNVDFRWIKQDNTREEIING